MTNENLQDSFNDLSEAVMTDAEMESFEDVQKDGSETPGEMVSAIALGILGDVSIEPPTTDTIIRTRLKAVKSDMYTQQTLVWGVQARMRELTIEKRKLERLVAVLDRIDAAGDE